MAGSDRRGAAASRDNPALRVMNGVLMAAVLAGCAVADRYVGGGLVFTVLLALVVALSLGEFYGLAARAGARPVAWVGIAGGVFLVAVQWLGGKWPAAGAGLGLSPLPVAAAGVLGAVLAAHLGRHGVEEAWRDVGAAVLGLALVTVPAASLALMRSGFGIGAVAVFVGTVKMSDVGAYAVGRLVGRRPLAPVVSPKKTVAGAAAGLAAGCGAAVALRAAWPAAWGGMGLGSAALFGSAAALFGILGDLGESVFKRAAAVKDASGLLPGFGGVLDVVDSVWGAAPAAYLVFALFRGA